jgi:hypothetical protein
MSLAILLLIIESAVALTVPRSDNLRAWMRAMATMTMGFGSVSLAIALAPLVAGRPAQYGPVPLLLVAAANAAAFAALVVAARHQLKNGNPAN